MGVEYLRQDQTGAWSWSGTLYCGGEVSCPTVASYRVEHKVAGGGTRYTYHDSLGRLVRETTIGFDGTPIHVDTEYDHSGNVQRVSVPYFEYEMPAGWTQNHYDIIDRVVATDLPDGTRGGTSVHEAYTTTVTNALGQKQIEVRDLQGRVIHITDNLGGTISNQYDLSGNLIAVTTEAPDAGSVTVRMCYDDQGYKVAMHDPDKGGFIGGASASCEEVAGGDVDGWWRYQYNGLGELVKQIDPKGQVHEFTYDALGRRTLLVQRLASGDVDLRTRWFYDGGQDNPPPGHLGNLSLIKQGGDSELNCEDAYCTVFTFDELGRMDATANFSSDSYIVNFTMVSYDAIGRRAEQSDILSGVLLPTSGSREIYNRYGYRSETRELDTDELLRRTLTMNVFGKVTEEERGNGVVTRYEFDPYFGRLQHQNATIVGVFPVQQLTYRWDALGNLISRHNESASADGKAQKNLQESFCYDGLNRLIKSHHANLAGSCSLSNADQDVEYDGLGNITRKAGVGQYSYGREAGPHAVTEAGGIAYTYDLNGNMVSGDGRTITYNSADQAVEIRVPGQTTYFRYAPGGERYRRIDVYANQTVTTDYMGALERIQVEGSETVTWRKTVAGTLYTRTTKGDLEVQGEVDKSFTYIDHLGSTDVITNEFGQVVESQSFDAWGQRRNSIDWSDLTTAQRLGLTPSRTPRGYTGHEQLDSLGLIHMNGRIYDPKLARFLQADPFIQAASHTQSYNRYSYLWNNPLNATDPSGFFRKDLKKLWNKLRPMVGAFVGIGLVFLVPGGAWFVQSWYGAATAGAISGAAGAAANGGNILRGALTGAIAGAAFYGIGTTFEGAEAVLAHASTGGLISLAQGGKFGHGFASAGLTKAFNINNLVAKNMTTPLADAARTLVAGLAGGTISAMTGGKFANGATTAALAQAFNGNKDLKREEAAAQEGADHYSRNAENDQFFRDEGLYDRKDLTLKELQGAGDYGMKQVSAAETAYHRIGEGNENNIKLTSKVALKESWYQKTWSNRYGRYEFIARPNVDAGGNFTGTYTHVIDSVNMGTLNRGNNPITHVYRDVIPYKRYGNAPN